MSAAAYTLASRRGYSAGAMPTCDTGGAGASGAARLVALARPDVEVELRPGVVGGGGVDKRSEVREL